jgi:histidine triad (HIT) family protein
VMAFGKLSKLRQRYSHFMSKYTFIPLDAGHLAIGGQPSLPVLEGLKNDQCTTVVTLMGITAKEKPIAERIGKTVKSLGMDWIWFPISATDLPRGKGFSEAKKIMRELESKLANNERIFVHCAAGIHRIGAFTYGFLRYLGYPETIAKETIQQLRSITSKEAMPKHWDWGAQFSQVSPYKTPTVMPKSCIFCKIIQKELPASVVYEDEAVMAIMDIQPINPGHVLVLPKQCYQFLHQMPVELTQQLITVVAALEKAVRNTEGITCEGTNVIQNNGREAGQEIDHVHFHVIPRVTGDGFRFKFQTTKPTRAELDALAEKIKI